MRDFEQREVARRPLFVPQSSKKLNNIMYQNRQDKAVRLEMVEIDHSRFAAEILRGNARVNLTQMAKPFGKRVADWLRTDESKEYLSMIAKAQKCVLADLVEVRHGGTPGTNGTWCNDYRIAMRFAQWLSPRFSVAVDEMLIRLMLGEAVLAESINGVEPLVWGGSAWYNYRDVLESIGVSRRCSASRRKKSLPREFRTIYGRNFITARYFRSLVAYSQWKQQYRQLELEFDHINQLEA